MSETVLRRVLRRETHSSRSVAFAVVVLLTIVACVYLAIETVLSLASQPALLVRPIDALAWLAAIPADIPVGVVVAGGLAVAVLGVWLILLAVSPGRLSKHEMDAGGRAALVDNGVLAAAIAQRVSDETGLARDRVTVGVAHRSVDVSVKPGAGIPVDRAQVSAVAEAELSGFKLTRPLRTRVRVERTDDEKEAA
jgi:hypothetical protein